MKPWPTADISWRAFPKHLETYRLLGKAYLEAKRHDQAVDIFQRVLVSAPDDFVSHVGMSIIADDQGKLDEAIWHMERAFEVQPSNAAIQGELQRLFGRRDGMEPPKIRLTRGALAHMYVQGELYQQAISEVRAVLATDAERMDMQVLLARAYYSNGQKAEAADICSTLLATSPYCLDANRLMAEILPGTQATEAAQQCRRRVVDMDPYADLARGSLFATDAVPDGAVTLERLEYSGEKAELGASIGMGLASRLQAAKTPDAAPSWLSPGASVDKPVVAADLPAQPDQDLPEFLRGSGWREVPAGLPVEPEGFESTDLKETAPEPEPDVVAGVLPEWVKALAPNEEQAPSPASAATPQAQGNGAKVASGPLDSQAGTPTGSIEATPDWLRDLAKDAEPPNEAAPAVWHPTPGPESDGSTTAAASIAMSNDNGLAWLEGLAEKHGAKPEELITPPQARTQNPPEWLQGSGEEEAAAPEGWRPVEAALPDPVSNALELEDETPLSPKASSMDWLSGLADSNAFAEMEKPADNDEGLFSEAAVSPRTPAAELDNLPDWLSDKPQDAPVETAATTGVQAGKNESSADLPDWLSDLDGAKGELAPAGAPGDDQVPDVPLWLQAAPQESLEGASQWRPAAVDGVPEESATARAAEAMAVSSSVTATARAPEGTPSREPLPSRARPVPTAPAPEAPSLGAAKAELARGNIAAALDIYGRLIRKGRSLTEIIRELRDALYRYPVEVSIWQSLGDAYMRADRLQEALDAYTKAEELLR